MAALRILRLADQSEPRVRQQVERALRQLQQMVNVTALEQILKSRDYFSMSQLASQLPSRMLPALSTLRRLYTKAASEEVAKLRRSGIRMNLQMTDPYMIEAARRNAATLLANVSTETQKAVRSIIARSFEEGLRPRDAAKMIRSVVGLTDRQARSVFEYRSRLIADGYTDVQATAAAEKMADRLLTYRAKTIARTETIAAATAGQLASWRAAQQRGLISTSARKVWITTADDRLCRHCLAMDGQEALLYSTFESGSGPLDAPPLHPNCRCAIGIRLRSLRKAA